MLTTWENFVMKLFYYPGGKIRYSRYMQV